MSLFIGVAMWVLELQNLLVVQGQRLADRGNNDAGIALPGFAGQYVDHDVCIGFVQMADRLVEQQEVERLAQAAYEGYALLLAVGQFAYRHVGLVGYL